jgi:rhodanese-related sulfurtransferase
MTASNERNPSVAFPLRVFRQAGWLLAVALVPAVLTLALHPRRPVWSKDQTLAPMVEWSQVRQWPGLVLVLDARSTAAFDRAHIPDALPLNEAGWEEQLPAVLGGWRPGVRVVVYCDNSGCDASQAVARRLRRDLGADGVFVLKGGWSAWLETQKPGK